MSAAHIMNRIIRGAIVSIIALGASVTWAQTKKATKTDAEIRQRIHSQLPRSVSLSIQYRPRWSKMWSA